MFQEILIDFIKSFCCYKKKSSSPSVIVFVCINPRYNSRLTISLNLAPDCFFLNKDLLNNLSKFKKNDISKKNLSSSSEF